ncbi:conserved hypothetical protein [Culex quinquefasciatus]|uniref:WW domain binding protein VOPP1 n=1 Tax=Culex quinquefasciatus TaxID=7176 RepID=B0XE66_CULQU|nr:conserved hypothetical protein [Culex quinquefasciatus]|eukprot:XP_001867938.1 conserved hypothetical protein [Culex quinquefasciatus]
MDVAARFCEGGHRCLPPKECCAQGCCYLYAPPSAPRTPTPATDHVLNLFFINHWYFWCFLLAIVLALLCACSLWKKRRQLCGWGSPGHHSQSEGDSAGSCYAPPQYSRCNSFHIHAPPPYTEVTSKPDLYPLVFSYTGGGDTGKSGNHGGANYLMVQYFRNYIVRPVGSMSGTSTVDSLSSSFICTANEANTLVPPPYSRAASPDLSAMSVRNYGGMHRSASQQACTGRLDRGKSERCPATAQSQTSEHNNSTTGAANIYSSCGSIGGISITIPANSEHEYQDLNALRRSLETCCQILQQQQKQAQFQAHHQPSSGFTANIEDSPINVELAKRFEGLRSSYIGSNTGSNVSSLANLGTPDSPPRATSPTVEVRELLEQIRQLQNISATNSTSEGIIIINPQPPPGPSTNASNGSINVSSGATAPTAGTSHIRRPSSLISKKKFFCKAPSQGSSLGGHKAMYIPISSNQNQGPAAPPGRSLRSPSAVASAAAAGLLSRGRSRCSWMSKSAPTTPGTALPPGGSGTGAIGDNSPLLLNEQDEDGEQNV